MNMLRYVRAQRLPWCSSLPFGAARCLSAQNAPRTNECGVEMLAGKLWANVFDVDSSVTKSVSKASLGKIKEHLEHFDLWDRDTKFSKPLPEHFEPPPLLRSGAGLPKNTAAIVSHFDMIAHSQFVRYQKQIDKLSKFDLPPRPDTWPRQAGWSSFKDGAWSTCAGPEEDAMVFDVEVAVRHGKHAVLAIAVTENAWYMWCAKQLVGDPSSAPELIPFPVRP